MRIVLRWALTLILVFITAFSVSVSWQVERERSSQMGSQSSQIRFVGFMGIRSSPVPSPLWPFGGRI